MTGVTARLALVLALTLVACKKPEPPPRGRTAEVRPPAVPWSDAWLDGEAERFLDDLAARRGALEASLKNAKNSYSRQRLGSYALGDRGWDTLPAWNPRSAPVTANLAARIAAGQEPGLPEETPPLWDGQRPTTQAGWVALGRRVFFAYPLREDAFVEYALARPALAAEVGIERPANGEVPGAVVFASVDGTTRIGITCALCHSAVERGELIVGRARRRFDYGRLRLFVHRETGESIEPELARRMAGWGPGRADVTEDNDEDPVAIPDLWGLRAQSALTQAGTIRHIGPSALAIRQETQLLHSNHQRVRPPRELAWALAMFVYSLEPPPPAPPPVAAAARDRIARGGALFALACAGCHSNSAYGGDPVPVARVGTDPALAEGGARGTGQYRPPSLLGVASAAPYLHHGAVQSLEDLLAPERLAPGYRRGVQGPGPVVGHAFGTDWPEPDRAAVVAFLRTL
ncbi:MAG: hypothetical protein EXR72_08920 [Myxococcales bacterium]|nr:hypothetical protein [Myxococcales bacterium]